MIDIAAGPGDLGFQVAELVGGGGRVMSTDFAPEMVEVARRLGEARGVGNVDHAVLDAERMGLEDDCVDAAVCRWGYMLMADPGAALRETRRILREGGPLAFAVWASPERNPWAALPAATLVQRGHLPPPEPGAPGIFALADPIGSAKSSPTPLRRRRSRRSSSTSLRRRNTSGTRSSAWRARSPGRSTSCPTRSWRPPAPRSSPAWSPSATVTAPTRRRRSPGGCWRADPLPGRHRTGRAARR